MRSFFFSLIFFIKNYIIERYMQGGIKMIINGKEIAESILEKIKLDIDKIKQNNQRTPKLVVVQIGCNSASSVYVNNKEKTCKRIGMDSEIYRLDEETTQEELLSLVKALNKDGAVDGILVQLPLPKHIDEKTILETIDPSKDVDGFHPQNIAKLFLGTAKLVPCTPKGILAMLKTIGYDLAGKEVVVVGRSNIVGKPVSLLALHENATVTICHSKTDNLKEVCKRADVLIVAIGKAKMINHEYVKDGSVIIDVGMNRDENNKLCGDVDFDDVESIASMITPVPKGVGPMTIAMLLENTMLAYNK